ncbi:MAG: biotin--[acetyl-CoA-carboxylase] ligase [Clostridia bacterium]|nr:biotin--[acetyl-CoA-carboxylase] ligase [Clostridia bacterium]
MSLHPDFWQNSLTTCWAGRGDVDYHETLPSTNSRLKELARQGAPHGALCLCDDQTAGRGRLQRSWLSQPGDALTFSLLLKPALPAEQLPLCTFAAALAVHESIRQTCPGLTPGVKWPNDIVTGGKKCVGILSELVMGPEGEPCVVMGVGINVAQTDFPQEIRQTATSLLRSMQAEDPSATVPSLPRLLCCFLEEMEAAMALLEGDLPAFMESYRRACVTLDKRVRVIGRKESFIGTAEDIDPTGALLVRDENNHLQRVLSGDVSVRGLMGYTD